MNEMMIVPAFSAADRFEFFRVLRATLATFVKHKPRASVQVTLAPEQVARLEAILWTSDAVA
jgi:hypothetical protein